MKLVLERVYGVEPVVYLLHLTRVEFDVVDTRPHLIGHIFNLYVAVVEAFRKCRALLEDGCDVVEMRNCRLQRVQQSVVFAVHHRVDEVERCLYLLSMTHGLRPLLQLLLLTSHKVSIGKLLILEPHEIGFCLVCSKLLLHAFEHRLCLLQGEVSGAVARKGRCVAGHDVEHADLKIFFAEQQVLVLTVYVDKMLPQLPHGSKCHRRVVYERPALSCRADLAAQDTLVGNEVEVVVVKKLLYRAIDVMARREGCLDNTFWSPRLHLTRVGTVARKQSERTENNALARSRLARYHGEAGKEAYVELIDEREIAYM